MFYSGRILYQYNEDDFLLKFWFLKRFFANQKFTSKKNQYNEDYFCIQILAYILSIFVQITSKQREASAFKNHA